MDFNEYYDNFANDADPADLLKLGRATIIQQVRELDPEVDAAAAADGILAVAAQLVAVRSRAAALLGRKGGRSTSEAKRAAVKENGHKGGRPILLYDSGEMGVGGNRDRVTVYRTQQGIRVDYSSLYSDIQPGSRYYWEGNYPALPADWDNRDKVENWFYHLDGSHRADRIKAR